MADKNQMESIEFKIDRDALFPLLLEPVDPDRKVYYPPWLLAKHIFEVLIPLEGESEYDTMNRADRFIKDYPIDVFSLSSIISLMLEARESLVAQERVFKKLANDPKQAEKKFVHECWNEWRANSARYKSKAAFARDMLDKCKYLTSQKKIEDWCREWENENPNPAG